MELNEYFFIDSHAHMLLFFSCVLPFLIAIDTTLSMCLWKTLLEIPVEAVYPATVCWSVYVCEFVCAYYINSEWMNEFQHRSGSVSLCVCVGWKCRCSNTIASQYKQTNKYVQTHSEPSRSVLCRHTYLRKHINRTRYGSWNCGIWNLFGTHTHTNKQTPSRSPIHTETSHFTSSHDTVESMEAPETKITQYMHSQKFISLSIFRRASLCAWLCRMEARTLLLLLLL